MVTFLFLGDQLKQFAKLFQSTGLVLLSASYSPSSIQDTRAFDTSNTRFISNLQQSIPRLFDTSCTRFISNLQQSIPRLFDTSCTRSISNLQQSIPRLLKQTKQKLLETKIQGF